MNTYDEEIAAFPLCWPVGWPRIPKTDRKEGRFGGWTVYGAVEGLKEELRLMGAIEPIVSTSIPLRKDGIPMAKPPVDGDSGAAVYFKIGKRPKCIAIDKYLTAEENIRAITLTIKAMRDIERHGSAEVLDRAFTGFNALPQNAGGSGAAWWEVLEVAPFATEVEVERNWRRLVKLHHPDTGGDHAKMASINEARDKALAEIEGRK